MCSAFQTPTERLITESVRRHRATSRMACDLGLNLGMSSEGGIDEAEEDARRITFWGCFLFDK